MKPTFNYSKLQGRIKECFGSQASFAKALGLSEPALSQRLNNKTEFSQDEIVKAMELLEVPGCCAFQYFFTLNVRKTKQEKGDLNND